MASQMIALYPKNKSLKIVTPTMIGNPYIVVSGAYGITQLQNDIRRTPLLTAKERACNLAFIGAAWSAIGVTLTSGSFVTSQGYVRNFTPYEWQQLPPNLLTKLQSVHELSQLQIKFFQKYSFSNEKIFNCGPFSLVTFLSPFTYRRLIMKITKTGKVPLFDFPTGNSQCFKPFQNAMDKPLEIFKSGLMSEHEYTASDRMIGHSGLLTQCLCQAMSLRN